MALLAAGASGQCDFLQRCFGTCSTTFTFTLDITSEYVRHSSFFLPFTLSLAFVRPFFSGIVDLGMFTSANGAVMTQSNNANSSNNNSNNATSVAMGVFLANDALIGIGIGGGVLLLLLIVLIVW
jgi:hypothetical protein